MATTLEQPTATITGAWTAWHPLTPQAEQVFKTAIHGLVGTSYTPLGFASQIVAGTNYAFLCQGKPAYLNPPETFVVIYVFQPLQGEPHITKIEQISPK